MIIAIPTGITVPLTIYLTKLKSSTEDNKTAIDKNDSCITRLEGKIDAQDVKIDTVKESVETKMEAAKSALQVDLKQLHIDIVALNERVKESQEVHTELKQTDKETKQFFADWIQRVEDLLRSERSGFRLDLPRGSTLSTDIDMHRRLDSIEHILMKLMPKKEKLD